MIANLSVAPRFTLERHQLAQVICQVRFSPVLRLNQQEEVVLFQEEVRERYPGFLLEPAVALMITPQGVVQQDTGTKIYRFLDPDASVVLVLGVDFVAIETREYVAIEDVIERVRDAVSLVERFYRPAQRTRLGLRFTNELRFEPDNLQTHVREALNPQLLGPLGDPDLAPAVETTQSVIHLRTEAGNMLQVIHGLNPQGGTTVLPMPGSTPSRVPQDPFYLLDFDAYAPDPLPLNADAVADQATVFNDQIRTLFAWSTTADYRSSVLGQRDLT
jgi:uncharacterized protein (TIGR04255 family)